jgi:hypothetical protein
MFGRFLRPSRVAIAGLALCGGLSGMVLVGTAGTASASTASAGPSTITADSSNLNLDVTSSGLVVQDYLYGGPSEVWYVPAVESTGRIKNYYYNECLTTDGVQGDQLYLKPCTRGLSAYQRWSVGQSYPGALLFTNTYFNLDVDVYANSYQPGAPIDAWPNNGGYNNQRFQVTNVNP